MNRNIRYIFNMVAVTIVCISAGGCALQGRARLLDTFIERNIPELYSFRQDSSSVEQIAEFISDFGVTEEEAVEHYMGRRARRDVVIFGAVATNSGQCHTGSSGSDKVQNCKDGVASGLIGDIQVDSSRIADGVIRLHTICNIQFRQNSATVEEDFRNNHQEIGKIKRILIGLAKAPEQRVDSIIVRASSSPEGSFGHNAALAQRRSDSISGLLSGFAGDSLRVGADEDWLPKASFIARNEGENWQLLDSLVANDDSIGYEDKIAYIDAYNAENPDEREKGLQGLECYDYIVKCVYPLLRTVCLEFHISKEGPLPNIKQ